MINDESLQAQRAAFFDQIRNQRQNGGTACVWTTKLDVLWPGENGSFDEEAVHRAFQQEEMHLEWNEFKEKGWASFR